MSDAPPVRVLIASDDLLFPSRLREALRPLGHSLQVVPGTASAVRDAVGTGDAPPFALFVNLNARRFDPLILIRELKASQPTLPLRVVAFAGHVETEKHAAARAAGADLVVANSSVSFHLPSLLAKLYPETPTTPDHAAPACPPA
jgi:CheY-like chemotaxis protein